MITTAALSEALQHGPEVSTRQRSIFALQAALRARPSLWCNGQAELSCARRVEAHLHAQNKTSEAEYSAAVRRVVLEVRAVTEEFTLTLPRSGQALQVLVCGGVARRRAVFGEATHTGREAAEVRAKNEVFGQLADAIQARAAARTRHIKEHTKCRGCHRTGGIEHMGSKQTQGSDEPETFYYRCKLCGHHWSDTS